MPRFSTGTYKPKNPQKYVGTRFPIWRSSWELSFMRFADNHPSVLKWASESIRIPYRHPLTGKPTTYVPDFFVLYENKAGNQYAEIIEIKPLKQTSLQEAGKSRSAQVAAVINQAKWAAAQIYAKRMGVTFRVITEAEIYRKGTK